MEVEDKVNLRFEIGNTSLKYTYEELAGLFDYPSNNSDCYLFFTAHKTDEGD